MSSIESLLESAIAKRREKFISHDQHSGYFVPIVPPAAFRKLALLGKGKRSAVYHAKINEDAPPSIHDLGKNIVVKEFFGLAERMERHPHIANVFARDILRTEDAKMRLNQYAIPVLGYSYHDNAVSLVLEKGDGNFLDYTDDLWKRSTGKGILKDDPWDEFVTSLTMKEPPLDRKIIGKYLMDVLIPAAKGLSSFHHNGYTHRDVKTSNLILTLSREMHVAQAKWGDMSESLGADDEDDGTDLDFGTFENIPAEIWFGTMSEKDLPAHFRDIYAFGRIISRVAFRENSQEESGPLELSLADAERMYREKHLRREEFRRSNDLETSAVEIGLPGIERIMIRATDIKNGYTSMDDIVSDLESVAKGNSHKVIRNDRHKIAWNARKKEEKHTEIKTIAKRILLTTAIAALSWYTPIVQQLRNIVDQKIGYAQSVQIAARAADNGGLQNFINRQADVERNDMRKLYLPELKSGAKIDLKDGPKVVFPYGTVIQAKPLESSMLPIDQNLLTRTIFFQPNNSTSKYTLEILCAEAKLTDDVQFMRWYVKYASKMDFDSVETQDAVKTSDLRMGAVGRYAPILRDVPAAIEKFSDVRRKPEQRLTPAEIKILNEAYDKALDAAAIALRHYDPKTRTFRGVGAADYPIRIDVDKELFITEIAKEVVNLQGKDLQRVLDPASHYAGKEDLSPIQQYLKDFKPLSKPDVYEMIAFNGEVANPALVRPDGKSFWKAMLEKDGRVSERKTYMDDLGYNGNEDAQAVIAQYHADLILTNRYRIIALSAAKKDRVLRAELGDQYNAFLQRMEAAVNDFNHYNVLLRGYLGTTGMHKEYAFMPSDNVANRLDSTVDATLAYEQALAGKFAKTGELLSEAELPRGSYALPGLMQSSRGFLLSLHGSMFKPDALLVQSLALQKY